ncbi:MAG: hypothetical protein H6741_12180 [Alphaproteobacteria bacterium]|nr:hypothetical protein [Alphaproteobacteria bacterium]
MRSLILSTFLLIGACSDKDSTDDSGGDDSGAVDADIQGDFHFVDFATGADLEGVSVSGGDADSTTDATGSDDRTLDPNAAVEIVAMKAGYMENHVFLFTGSTDFNASVVMLSEETMGRLYPALGIERDLSKGTVVITVNDDAEGGSHDLEGATVTLDAAAERVIAADSTTTAGFTDGNTTQAGANGWVVFLNVDPGEVNAEVETPDGEDCVVFPGETDDMSFQAIAGALSVLAYECE